MTTLTIVADTDAGVKPLLCAAIDNEGRILEAGVARTERRIRRFEDAYGLATDAFLARYRSGLLQESLDFDEWIGEHRTLRRLREKLAAVRGLRIED